jgi:phosphoglycolate phosphatase
LHILDLLAALSLKCAALKYRLVIFDSDGTLADTLPWMRGIFNELADKHGFRRVEPNEYENFRDLPVDELLKALGLPLWKLPRVMNGMRSRMAARIEHFTLFDGIDSVLRKLNGAGIQIAVVSSNSRFNVERILRAENARLITHFGCGVSIFGKAAKLRAVVRASGISAGQTIYVGDEIRDAEAAKKAGIAFGAVAWGQHSPNRLRQENPAEFFERVDQIAALLC